VGAHHVGAEPLQQRLQPAAHDGVVGLDRLEDGAQQLRAGAAVGEVDVGEGEVVDRVAVDLAGAGLAPGGERDDAAAVTAHLQGAGEQAQRRLGAGRAVGRVEGVQEQNMHVEIRAAHTQLCILHERFKR
jgi:hypothetical protein